MGLGTFVTIILYIRWWNLKPRKISNPTVINQKSVLKVKVYISFWKYSMPGVEQQSGSLAPELPHFPDPPELLSSDSQSVRKPKY